MSFSNAMQTMRKKALLTQDEFAKALGIAPSTVNRWETDKAKPNLSTMKKIKAFCIEHEISFEPIEKAWITNEREEENNG